MLLPSTRQLDAFLRVAKLNSFRRAAEAMHMSQSALSQSIAQLEQYFGTALFHRSTRDVRPTAAGEILARRLERIVPELHETMEAVRDIGTLAMSRLRIGCIPSVALRFLPTVIGKYKAANPNVRILVMDGTTDRLHAAVLSDSIDFAITSSTPVLSPELNFELVYVDPFRALLRRDHVLAKRKSLTWTELFEFDFLGWAFGSGSRIALEHAFAANAKIRQPMMELSQLGTVLGMVDAGLGVSAISQTCCPPDDHPTLCSRPLTAPEVTREMGLVTRRGAVLSTPASDFLGLLVEAIKTRRP